MNIELGIKTIREVAIENNFKTTVGTTNFEIYKDRVHSESFKIKKNSHGYIQVHEWEEKDYGRCIYSLRTFNDIINFCNIMITSTNIRAGR
jgi:hypothetical protein